MTWDTAAPERPAAYRAIMPGNIRYSGVDGQVFFLMMKLFFLVALLLAVSCCGEQAADRLQSGKVIGLFGLEGRWTGPVTPQSDGCGTSGIGLMSVGLRTFAFDPFQGTTVISGTVSDAVSLRGALVRAGNGQQPSSISFSGEARQRDGGDETIDGELVSGRCSWTVSLKRG